MVGSHLLLTELPNELIIWRPVSKNLQGAELVSCSAYVTAAWVNVKWTFVKMLSSLNSCRTGLVYICLI